VGEAAPEHLQAAFKGRALVSGSSLVFGSRAFEAELIDRLDDAEKLSVGNDDGLDIRWR